MSHRGHRSAVVVTVLALGLLLPQRAVGWSSGGHRVVANIAYDQLSKETRAGIVKVLRRHEDFKKRFKDEMPAEIQNGSAEDQDRWVFLQASIWPDLIRSVPKYHQGTWHYINLPYFLSPFDQNVLQNVIKPNVSFVLPDPLTNVVRDQLNCVQAFKLCLRELKDADTTDAERAIYFCWFLHIGGDIHQPLHSTSLVSRGRFHEHAGDKGGNGIKVKQGKNLHSYWDGLLGGDQNLNNIRKRAVAILAEPGVKQAAEKATENLDIETWVQESHKLAKEFVYHKLVIDEVTAREGQPSQPLQKVELPQAYLQQAGQHAHQRVAQAGYRLAELLKQIEE